MSTVTAIRKLLREMQDNLESAQDGIIEGVTLATLVQDYSRGVRSWDEVETQARRMMQHTQS
jgi:hypothetical protein